MIDIEKYLMNNNTNKHYLNKYINYITGINNKGARHLDSIEKHHIIPRCINKDLYTDINNLIKLTPREHYIAHLILSRCFKENTNEYNRLVCALFAMSSLKMKYHKRQNIEINSRQYENLRIKYGEVRHNIMKDQIKLDKYKKLIGKGQPSTIKGKISITNGSINKFINKEDIIPEGWYKGNTQTMSKETKIERNNKLKQAWSANKEKRTGKNHPMYGKGYLVSGHKNGMYGKHRTWINKDGINKYIEKSELNYYLSQGWNSGMVRSNGLANGFICVYKGNDIKYIAKEELSTYLDNGWKRGNPKSGHKGKSNPAYGKLTINNGIICKRVLPDELDNYLNKGWQKGMLKRK